jgi:hypothetical protein
MPIVHPCSTEGCSTLTMGEFCLACETAMRENDEHDLLVEALRMRSSANDETKRQRRLG